MAKRQLKVALAATGLLRVAIGEEIVGWKVPGLCVEWKVEYATIDQPCPICMKVESPAGRNSRPWCRPNSKKVGNSKYYRDGVRIPAGPLTRIHAWHWCHLECFSMAFGVPMSPKKELLLNSVHKPTLETLFMAWQAEVLSQMQAKRLVPWDWTLIADSGNGESALTLARIPAHNRTPPLMTSSNQEEGEQINSASNPAGVPIYTSDDVITYFSDLFLAPEEVTVAAVKEVHLQPFYSQLPTGLITLFGNLANGSETLCNDCATCQCCSYSQRIRELCAKFFVQSETKMT